MQVVNSTPWKTAHTMSLDGDGYETITLVVKANYKLQPRIEIDPEGDSLCFSDEHRGEPAFSSLARAGELAPSKLGADVLVTGRVFSFARDRTRGAARLRCGRIDKIIAAYGDRAWERRGITYVPSAPRVFESLPLHYELAYGGRDGDAFESANPAGVGFLKASPPWQSPKLPNFELPNDPVRGPTQRAGVAGMGPIAGHWSPRRELAGTYDEAWQRTRAPLTARDFDARFHQVAPRDQRLDGHVRGGEPVRIEGMHPSGALEFTLPTERPEIMFKFGRDGEEHAPLCDTVAIDAERGTLSMLFRARARVQGRLEKLLFMGVRRHGG